MDSLLCERWRDFSDFSWENESGREERELSSAVSVSSFFNWPRSGRLAKEMREEEKGGVICKHVSMKKWCFS